jgi:type II pantothenate kinase
MGATGGGAHKYADDWEKDLGISMDKQEELDSLVAGMQFVLSTVVGECYTFRPKSTDKSKNEKHKNPPDFRSSHSQASTESSGSNAGAPLSEDSDESDQEPPPANVDEWWWSRKVQRDAVSCSSTYPYLLVSIGTGVSILRVDGPRNHTRISGSTIGGGTYWGLIRLLTDVEDFDAVMKLAERGDPSKVDMMVGDIYGQNSDALEKLGLPSNIVASSFGKLVAKEDPAKGLKQEDLARALLLMVTNNIGQVAYLNAQLHKTPRIYFVGNFLRRNKISQRRLSSAISFLSKGEMEALFLEHEGYFGALGAFLLSQNISHSDQGFFQWDKRPNETGGVGETGSEPSVPAASVHRRSTTFGA